MRGLTASFFGLDPKLAKPAGIDVLSLRPVFSGEDSLEASRALRSAEVGDSPVPVSGLKKRGGVP